MTESGVAFAWAFILLFAWLFAVFFVVGLPIWIALRIRRWQKRGGVISMNLNPRISGVLFTGVLMVLIGSCGLTPVGNRYGDWTPFWVGIIAVGCFLLLLALVDRVRGRPII